MIDGLAYPVCIAKNAGVGNGRPYELLLLRSLATLLHQELVEELVKFDSTAHIPVVAYVTS
jgi:hypothetical protein